MAFLLSLMELVFSFSFRFLARTWLAQLHNVCTSHASRPPAYVSQAWQGGLASTGILVSCSSIRPSASSNSRCPWGPHLLTCRQYRQPMILLAYLPDIQTTTTPPLLLTSRSNDPIAEKTQRSSSRYSPQMTSGGAAYRMQAMLQTHMALRSVSQGLARFVAGRA